MNKKEIKEKQIGQLSWFSELSTTISSDWQIRGVSVPHLIQAQFYCDFLDAVLVTDFIEVLYSSVDSNQFVVGIQNHIDVYCSSFEEYHSQINLIPYRQNCECFVDSQTKRSIDLLQTQLYLCEDEFRGLSQEQRAIEQRRSLFGSSKKQQRTEVQRKLDRLDEEAKLLQQQYHEACLARCEMEERCRPLNRRYYHEIKVLCDSLSREIRSYKESRTKEVDLANEKHFCYDFALSVYKLCVGEGKQFEDIAFPPFFNILNQPASEGELRIKKGEITRVCHFLYRLSESFIVEAKDRSTWRQDICEKVNLNQGTFAKKYTQAKTYEYQKLRKNTFAEELGEVIKEHSEVLLPTK